MEAHCFRSLFGHDNSFCHHQQLQTSSDFLHPCCSKDCRNEVHLVVTEFFDGLARGLTCLIRPSCLRRGLSATQRSRWRRTAVTCCASSHVMGLYVLHLVRGNSCNDLGRQPVRKHTTKFANLVGFPRPVLLFYVLFYVSAPRSVPVPALS